MGRHLGVPFGRPIFNLQGCKLELKTFIRSLEYGNFAPEVRRGPMVYIPFANIIIEHIPTIQHLEKHEPVWKYNVRDIFAGNPLTFPADCAKPKIDT